jgi:uncharacterized protein (DUF2267 family)
MSSSGYKTLDTTVEKTNEVLGSIEEAYGWSKALRNQSYDALRAVLHTLRDRLTVQEASDLAAQLPMLIRGVFYEGWNPSKVPVKMDREEFFQHVQREFPYRVEGDMEGVVKNVLGALSRFITKGEMEDIKSNMPKDLATVLP